MNSPILSSLPGRSPSIEQFWYSYLESLAGDDPVRRRELPPAWSFGDGSEMADYLGRLVYQGTKTATCSSLWEIEHDGEPLPPNPSSATNGPSGGRPADRSLAPGARLAGLPQPGDLSVILGGGGDPLCVIETTEVQIRPFDKVDARFAYDEGEGDRSLAYWRAAHRRFFSGTSAAIGRTPDETVPLVCERFRVVWRAPKIPKATEL